MVIVSTGPKTQPFPSKLITTLTYLEFLIVNRADEDISAHGFAGDAGSEQILALIVVPVIDEDLGNVLDFVSAECSPVMEFTWREVGNRDGYLNGVLYCVRGEMNTYTSCRSSA